MSSISEDIVMINVIKMHEQAILAMKNAPNRDWQERGGAKPVGPLREEEISRWDGKVLGTATVGFYKFVNPLERGRFSFIGFMLAVSKVGQKVITEANPVIGSCKDEAYRNTACKLSNRFCPQCHELDSVTSSSRLLGPECVEITYQCKCGYIDHDVMD